MSRVAVTSRSFSKHPELRSELLKKYRDTTFNDSDRSLRGSDLIEFLKGHDSAITALEPMDEKVFAAVPELRVISKYGVGLDMVDISAMKNRGIRLGWAGGVNKRAVSELVIAMAISLLRHVPHASNELRKGRWHQHKGRQLSDRIVGIIGCGNVGKDLAVLVKAFGCKVFAYDIRNYELFYSEHHIEAADLTTLLRESDIVSLHLPLNNTTCGIIGPNELSLMRKDAVLINCARGNLVDEVALKSALENGNLAAAGFDVFSTEPPEVSGLLNLPNFLATPHIGGSTEEAILTMGRAAISGLETATIPDPLNCMGI
ncbi:MAG: phosphoglycerate dehydrogenase [Magnetovibrio sp.]|nr:phosphoglycerate dehydrogenase [Magnetovibrio sp.]|tara:strand:- start:25 stop:972 length:948 start_codon:yes stop_codon:yes gene_type:complete